jgi:hypothetical protein
MEKHTERCYSEFSRQSPVIYVEEEAALTAAVLVGIF